MLTVNNHLCMMSSAVLQSAVSHCENNSSILMRGDRPGVELNITFNGSSDENNIAAYNITEQRILPSAREKSLKKLKPNSVIQLVIPFDGLSTSAISNHQDVQSIERCLERHLAFLTKSFITPRVYKLKSMLVVRDYLETEHLVHMIKYLRSDIPIEKLFNIITNAIPISLLRKVLNEILDLFEHNYGRSDHFIAARGALKRYKMLNNSKSEEGNSRSSWEYYVRACICSDNNMQCAILTTNTSRAITQEGLHKALEFASENMNVPECFLDLLERNIA